MTVPEVNKAYVRGKASTETENLRVIESAKAQFSRAKPGKEIGSLEDLLPYLPNGKLPVSPWGTEYDNILSLEKTVVSLANGDPSKEPQVGDLASNGYNDLAAPDRIYFKRPDVPPPTQPPPPVQVQCDATLPDVIAPRPTGPPPPGACPSWDARIPGVTYMAVPAPGVFKRKFQNNQWECWNFYGTNGKSVGRWL